MDVIMPKMGESVSEGTIIKWHKKKGDRVKRDEIIFEISTDKVDTEIPSPSDGVLKEIKAEEGDTVEVGSVVAVIDTNGGAENQKVEDEKAAEEKSGVDAESSDKDETTEEEKVQNGKEEKTAGKTEEKPAEKVSENSGDIIEISMPKMGESVMEGTIIKWYKKKGDKVKKDETLFEISTDKVDTEVPSPEEGTVTEILVGEQETVEVGTIVAKLSLGEGKPVQKETQIKEKEQAETEKKTKEKEITREKKEKPSGRFYSPLVMNIAQKEDVSFEELKSIDGTGLEGRVTKNDILNYINDRKSGKKMPEKEVKKEKKKETAKEIPSGFEPSYSSADIEKIEMDNIRQKIMEHMVKSRDTSVHVSAMLEVDMSKIHNFIQSKREEYQKKEGIKLTYTPFIAHAVVKGLKEYSLINAVIEGTTIIKKKYINLGIAVAIEPSGLIVPNIKSAGEKNIIGLAKSINDIANRARNKKLTPDDISGGTFTITNYGIFGTIFGTPIINQPEVAILGVGAVIKKPVVIEVDGSDTIAVKPMMALTLSHDHRLVDGMLGGRFLKFIKETLEGFDSSNI